MIDSPFAVAQEKNAAVNSGHDLDVLRLGGPRAHFDLSLVSGKPAGDRPAPLTQTQSDHHHSSGGAEQAFSFGGLARAEVSLICSLPQHFGTAFKDNLKNNWGTLAVEAGVSVVAGAAIAAATRNPAIVGRVIGQVIGHENPLALGEAMAPMIRQAVTAAPYLFGAAAAADVVHRLGAPAWDLMYHPDHQANDERQFAGNLSSVVQDYTVMGVAGAAGAKFSLSRTMPYVNKGPEVDFSPRNAWAEQNPGRLNKAARVKNPGDYVFAEEKTIAPDVNAQYEKAFPPEERQHVEGEGGYNEKIAQGDNMVYSLRTRTTDGTPGELAAAHILGVHGQPDPSPASHGIMRDFGNWLIGKRPAPLRSMHGDFIFVRDDLRSQGTGSFMYEKVVNAIQERAAVDGKHLVALTGEMENPKEPAVQLVNLVSDRMPQTSLSATGTPPRASAGSAEDSAKKLLQITRQQFPHGIEQEEPEAVGRALLQSIEAKGGPAAQRPATREQATTIGETLQTLDERTRRQEFYWALSTPKVDSGITWKIQDFADPEFRGDAHWTAVVFDPNKFAPRETGYAFMTDEAGYTLDPRSQQVREYEQANNYYRGTAGNAYTASSLSGILGATQDSGKR
jgi:hypothetical protein